MYPPNHGKTWSKTDLERARSLWLRGAPIREIAADLGRLENAVGIKLCDMGVAIEGPYSGMYHPKPATTTTTKETIMNDKLIETKTYILGVDADQATDDQIFTALAKAENEIKTLEAIEHKPKRLQARIDTLKADLGKLVDFLDNQDK